MNSHAVYHSLRCTRRQACRSRGVPPPPPQFLVDQLTLYQSGMGEEQAHQITILKSLITGKSVSEALILESVNPQYDDRLFKKIASSEHVKNMLCTKIVCFLF